MPRLVVISNRVALPEPGEENKAGGLAVAVNAALKNRSGLWFGWSGRVVEEPQPDPEIQHQGRITYAVVDLSTADFDEYYSGFANRVLWPILHYRVELAEFTRLDLSGYIRVNEMFADRVSRVLAPDDLVWVHDYHMMPLARYLRARGHDNRIGFFLHIPMPPPDILRAMPHHGEVIGAMADYDLVGLQTDNDRDNFVRYLAQSGAVPRRDGLALDMHGRRVGIGAFPVGIDTADYAQTASRSAASSLAGEVRASLGGRKLIIGVDRLDYSKGIAHRMDAFETFLATNPDWRGRVTYLQVTPKSRSDIPEYIEMDRTVSAKAGQINGTFGDAAWTPLRYINRAYSRPELAGLFRQAHVALVTPLRDGMNLVAKEYVAAQDPDDPGVLVLSQFAGAVAELREGALIVNPHEPEGVAAAIRRGLDMPLDERKDRFDRMIGVLTDNDIDHWAARFLTALSATRQRGLADNIRALFTL